MTSIELDNVSVWYSLRGKYAPVKREILKSPISSSAQIGANIAVGHQNRATVAQPLNGLSLSIREGDALGLIGGNGSGKTTLLKVITGCLQPQQGTVKIDGSVTSLLSMHGGVNPELSGYENIIQRALWLGYSRQEINEKIDAIAAETGLGEYLRMPIKIYSAGMNARLVFATVTAFQPEILIMDEGIIVGDEQFQRTARARVAELLEKTGIVVMASHSTELLRKNCTHGLWLDNGTPKKFGPIEDVLDHYRSSLAK
ncbi:MAG: ATP-binding cassette domain-containing protein [Ahrensia sp.]